MPAESKKLPLLLLSQMGKTGAVTVTGQRQEDEINDEDKGKLKRK